MRPAGAVDRPGPEHQRVQVIGDFGEPPDAAGERLGADLPGPPRLRGGERAVAVVRADTDQRAGAGGDQRDRPPAAGLVAQHLDRVAAAQPFDRHRETPVAGGDDKPVEHDIGREHAVGGLDMRPVDETRAQLAFPPWLG